MFFNKLHKWIPKYANNEQEIILGGDFNCTEFNMDKFTNVFNPKDVSLITYKTFKEKHNLHDIWRSMHPDKKQFTYLEKSRLDKFLISEECTNYTQKALILQAGIRSDHKCVKIELNLDSSKKGPGRWKLNTSILKDNTYKQNIIKLITNTKNEYNFLSN